MEENSAVLFSLFTGYFLPIFKSKSIWRLQSDILYK